MQFQSPWFWGLFGVSVVSGVVFHEFSFMTVFAPLWCFVVVGLLTQALSTGCLDDNAGPTFRRRQPVKYWARICVWLCGYALGACLPVVYALQERGKVE
ncbi:hypothetical protein [Prosthecobacter sp.]|uniref:hypothetical protein n=1 Tax=Prosthecobacter sp. TaxID=1965333 RepID=UPI0037848A57